MPSRLSDYPLNELQQLGLKMLDLLKRKKEAVLSQTTMMALQATQHALQLIFGNEVIWKHCSIKFTVADIAPSKRVWTTAHVVGRFHLKDDGWWTTKKVDATIEIVVPPHRDPGLIVNTSHKINILGRTWTMKWGGWGTFTLTPSGEEGGVLLESK